MEAAKAHGVVTPARREIAKTHHATLLGSIFMDFTKILLTSHGPKVRDHKLLISVSGSQWIIVVIVRSGGIGAARNHLIPLLKLRVKIREEPVQAGTMSAITWRIQVSIE